MCTTYHGADTGNTRKREAVPEVQVVQGAVVVAVLVPHPAHNLEDGGVEINTITLGRVLHEILVSKHVMSME